MLGAGTPTQLGERTKRRSTLLDTRSVVDMLVGSLVVCFPRCPCPNPQRSLPAPTAGRGPRPRGAQDELTGWPRPSVKGGSHEHSRQPQDLNHAPRSQTGGYLRSAPSHLMPFFGVKLGNLLRGISGSR